MTPFSDSLLSRFLSGVKYARRFIKNDGLFEYYHYLRDKPILYEKFDAIPGSKNYPAGFFQHLKVPLELQISKWEHYFDVYDHYLRELRNRKNLKILEIGVAGGGSLKMWRDYFDKSASIFGIDVNPKCALIENSGCEIRIGSQTNKDFLAKVIKEMGGIDVVLDDGSHINQHVIETFTFLFPLLNFGGIYLIEDTSTSYWPGQYKGGMRRRGTSIEFFKKLVDIPNRFFYRSTNTMKVTIQDVESVHFHPSIIVVQKRRRNNLQIWRNYA